MLWLREDLVRERGLCWMNKTVYGVGVYGIAKTADLIPLYTRMYISIL